MKASFLIISFFICLPYWGASSLIAQRNMCLSFLDWKYNLSDSDQGGYYIMADGIRLKDADHLFPALYYYIIEFDGLAGFSISFLINRESVNRMRGHYFQEGDVLLLHLTNNTVVSFENKSGDDEIVFLTFSVDLLGTYWKVMALAENRVHKISLKRGNRILFETELYDGDGYLFGVYVNCALLLAGNR